MNEPKPVYRNRQVIGDAAIDHWGEWPARARHPCVGAASPAQVRWVKITLAGRLR